MATDAIPPPFFITADDKRGLIVLTVALVLAFVWTCSLIRIWLRWQARDWRADDWLLAFATLVHTVQSGIIFHLVDLGLGTSQDGIPASQLEQLGKEGITSQIFYVCTLLLSKWSVLFLYLRLSTGGAHKVMSLAVVVASVIWAVMAVILIVVPCNPAQYYTNPQECTNRWSKWQAISSLDIVTEAFIFGIAVQLVWTLQMKLRSKLIVVFAFFARLPVIAIAGVRLYYLHRHFVGTKIIFEYIVATQWQMGYAIISSTITSMGPFLRPFNQEYTTSYHSSKYGYGHSTNQDVDTRSKSASSLPQRTSWQYEGYLMQEMPSRLASRVMTADTWDPSIVEDTAATHAHTTSTSLQAPNLLIADSNFRPVDSVSRTETDIWVGDRAASFGAEEHMPIRTGDDKRLIINKRIQVKIEVDRASCVI